MNTEYSQLLKRRVYGLISQTMYNAQHNIRIINQLLSQIFLDTLKLDYFIIT